MLMKNRRNLRGLLLAPSFQTSGLRRKQSSSIVIHFSSFDILKSLFAMKPVVYSRTINQIQLSQFLTFTDSMQTSLLRDQCNDMLTIFTFKHKKCLKSERKYISYQWGSNRIGYLHHIHDASDIFYCTWTRQYAICLSTVDKLIFRVYQVLFVYIYHN